MGQQFDDLDAFATAIDTETNNVAARVDRLVAQINAGMTQEQVDALKGKFGTVVTRLQVLGQDPEQPIPPDTNPQS